MYCSLLLDCALYNGGYCKAPSTLQMNALFLWFLAFHLLSLSFCFVTIHMTFQYLGRHYVSAKSRHLPLGFLRVHHVAVVYFIFILGLSFSSLVSLIQLL
jgi:hypothetical protein